MLPDNADAVVNIPILCLFNDWDKLFFFLSSLDVIHAFHLSLSKARGHREEGLFLLDKYRRKKKKTLGKQLKLEGNK